MIVTQIGEVEQSITATQSIDTEPGEVIRPADLPSAPTGMSLPITVIATGILGAIFGVGLALLRDRTDKTIRSHHDLVEISGEPLVEIPKPRHPGQGLPTVVDPAGAEASAYRALRVRIWPRRGIGTAPPADRGRRRRPGGRHGRGEPRGDDRVVGVEHAPRLAEPDRRRRVLLGRGPAVRRGARRRATDRADARRAPGRPRPHAAAHARPLRPRWPRGRDLDAPRRRASPSWARASTPRSSWARRCSPRPSRSSCARSSTP